MNENEIRQEIAYLKSALNQIGDAVILSEQQRIKDKKEILKAIQYLIDVQTHGYKKLSDKIQELSDES